MDSELWKWIGFNLFVLVMLVLDLGIFHRTAREVRLKESLAWTFLWISLAMIFNFWIYRQRGSEAALQFFTGYLIEYCLSVDNLFVFIMIFGYFHVPPNYQHKVLFWGILGAVLMRAGFIAAGVTLIHRFHSVVYIFGLILLISGIKMLRQEDKQIHPEKNPILKLLRRFIPVTPDYVEQRFFVRREGRVWATPLFVVLVVVESTDVIFAVDSVPAILAITQDPFIVYTSNIFAILGLRSLYFALASVMKVFHYLNYGLSVILIFVGLKMLLSEWFKPPIQVSLCVIVGVLALSVIASLIWPKPEEEQKVAEIAGEKK